MLNLIFLYILSIPIGSICGLYLLITQEKKQLSPRFKTFRSIANILLPVCIVFIGLTILAIYYGDVIHYILFDHKSTPL